MESYINGQFRYDLSYQFRIETRYSILVLISKIDMINDDLISPSCRNHKISLQDTSLIKEMLGGKTNRLKIKNCDNFSEASVILLT